MNQNITIEAIIQDRETMSLVKIAKKYNRSKQSILNYLKSGRIPKYREGMFSEDQVRAIRRDSYVHNMSIPDLAEKYGASRRTIGRVVDFDSYISVENCEETKVVLGG